MTDAIAAFVAAVFVSVVTIVFGGFQVKWFQNAYIEARGDVSLPFGLSPPVIATFVAQAADFAANFPAAILTIVAYALLNVLPPFWLVLVAVSVTGLSCIFAQPRWAAQYSLWTKLWVSPYSALILIANVIGLVLAIAGRGPA